MKKIINVSSVFSEKQTSQVFPAVKSVHVYPFRQGGVGNFIKSNHWALEYHSKDAGFIELKNKPGKWLRRRPNSVHIYAPGCCYREDTREADLPLEENYFIFTGGETCGLERLIAPELLCTFLRDTEGKIGNLMRSAGELCEVNGERAFWKVQAIFMEIIQLLNSAHRTDEGEWDIAGGGNEIDFADRVETYLRKNISGNIKTSDIARYMKVSESSLNHRFKSDTGISPIARLIEIRMDFAKSLLLKGEKLTTIADMTGFYDEYHLSKTFKKQTGLSPREFKNK
jgi:AraC-like DNA-binding protein